MERQILNRGMIANPVRFQNNILSSRSLLDRLGHTKTLKGHEGCVNCLQWNASGTLLASGSDDMCVRLWNSGGGSVHSFMSGHTNNIFSVQFLPGGNDEIVVSAAGDNSVRMHNVIQNETAHVWRSDGRVKRLAVNNADPLLFWSAAEDGFIKQYDLRTNEALNLIFYDDKMCKSLAINDTHPEMMAVGLDDAKVPVYDRRYIRAPLNEPVISFMPGHIPITENGARHTFRSLSVTHVGFNTRGNELIVNVGGEQIYIFNVIDRVEEVNAFVVLQQIADQQWWPEHPENVADAFPIARRFVSSGEPRTTSLEGESTERFKGPRERAKIHFNNREYTEAIDVYSRAIKECEALCGFYPLAETPFAADLCLLLSNRAASYLRRQWEGDVYDSLLDMLRVLEVDPYNRKAHYRIVKALVDLKQFKMAKKIAELFKARFPNEHTFDKLDRILKMDHPADIEWRHASGPDHVQRLCGHCNTNTDIKEAVFFGGRDQYIAAGSDCGSLLIWERSSGALVKAFEADKNILNCVQPHPTTFLLATSGIEHVIRFWEPLSQPENAEGINERERRSLSALSEANQRRMHTGVFEMVVESIGFAMRGEEDDDEVGQERRIGCTTS